jgi:hypothetical protein
MDRLQLVSVFGAAILFLLVLELVRRRQLLERYALLWLFASGATLGLALWSGGLAWLAKRFGILYAPNALFFVTLGFIVMLLLHFSAAVSRLTDQSKVLAQRLAILEERIPHLEAAPVVAATDDSPDLSPTPVG